MKTKHNWRAWLWTGPDENLFELDREAHEFFTLFVRAANSLDSGSAIIQTAKASA